MHTLTGYFRLITPDMRISFDLSETDHDDGIWLNLTKEQEEEVFDLEPGTLVAISVTEESVTDEDGITTVTAVDTRPWFTPITASEPGQRRLHMGIWVKVKPGTSDEEKARLEKMVLNKHVTRARDFLVRRRPGWDVQVRYFGPIESDEFSGPPTFCQKAVKAFVNERKEEWMKEGFFINRHMIIGDPHASYCGQAQCPGEWGTVYTASGACDWQTLAHEATHMDGRLHSGVHGSGQYTDATCTQGSAKIRDGYNAAHLHFLGGVKAHEIKEVPTQFFLAPLELPDFCLRENEYRAVAIPDPTGYFFSTRKTKGHPDALLDSRYENTVFVHGIGQRNQSWRYDKKEAGIKIGTSIETDTSTVQADSNLEYPRSYFWKTKNHKIENTINTKDECVHVTVGSITPSLFLKPHKNKFPTHVPSAILSKEHNGLWYNPLYNSQGLDCIIKEDRMTILWYTFAANGSPRWFIGSCDVGEGLEEFKIYSTEGQFDLEPNSLLKEEEGSAQLYFLNENRGRFLWWTKTHGRGGMELQRLSKSSDELSGLFYDQSRDGEGFSVQFYDDRKRCSFYWYTYRQDRAEQIWFYGSGLYNEDTEKFDIHFYQPHGYFMRTDGVYLSTAGTGELEIVDENQMNFSYKMSESLKRRGKMSLTRLL